MQQTKLTSLFALCLTSTLALACGDDTAPGGDSLGDGDADTDTGTTDGQDEVGDNDADTTGDGDGDTTTTGDGDGDTTTGDGDGDTTTGDGDGDTTTTGDGDGDAMCPLEPEDTECDMCVKESCCAELMACEADETCVCITDCVAEGGNELQCGLDCGVMGVNQAALNLTTCTSTNCLTPCGA